MPAFRLETFRPLVAATADDGYLSPEATQVLRDTAYAAGVKAGAASATAAFEAEKTRLLDPILQVLQDATQSRAEARMAVLASLRPLLDMLVSTILPPLAHEGLISTLSEVLTDAARRAPEASFTLELAPENTDAIAAVLKDTPTSFRILAVTTLGPLEARLRSAGGFDAIDLRQTLNEAQAVCARFFTQTATKTSPEKLQQGHINAR